MFTISLTRLQKCYWEECDHEGKKAYWPRNPKSTHSCKWNCQQFQQKVNLCSAELWFGAINYHSGKVYTSYLCASTEGSISQPLNSWLGPDNFLLSGKPGVLQFMESRRVRHNWETKKHYHLNSTMYSPGIFSNVCRHFWLSQYPAIHRAAPDNKKLSGPSQEFRGWEILPSVEAHR